MKDIFVVYFSGTGNTESMAQAVGKGITAAGANARVEEVSQVQPDQLADQMCFALGCPACGAEELDEAMESFMEGLSDQLEGKQVGLFGSFGWGDGDWMKEWEKRITEAGGSILSGEGIIVNGEPDDDILASCENLGKGLVQ